MKSISKTSFKVEEVLKLCISNLSDETLKQEFQNNIRIFINHDKILDEGLSAFKAYQIAQNFFINAILNENALKKLYTDKFSKKGQPGRDVYDKILSTAPNEKCPYCNQRFADTLDHFLPKASFPIYSISPINLLPACTPCNKGKLKSIPENSVEQTLHPYFDNIEKYEWLECEISNLPDIVFSFKTRHIEGVDDLLNHRISNHFKFYHLNKLYKSNASSEFANIKDQITRIFQNKGSEELKDFLNEAYLSRKKNDANSWQTALYKGFKSCADFVAGKFI